MDAKKRKTARVGYGRFVCKSPSSAQSNAHDERRLVTLRAGAAGSRVRASEKTAWITGRGRLEGRGYQFTETASNETDCTRDSASQGSQIGIARLSKGDYLSAFTFACSAAHCVITGFACARALVAAVICTTVGATSAAWIESAAACSALLAASSDDTAGSLRRRS